MKMFECGITQKEHDVLCDLQTSMAKAFKSKPTLSILSVLLAKGLIEWNPLAGTGKLTEAGLSLAGERKC